MTRTTTDNDTAAKAAKILAADRDPDRAEQAAINCLRNQAWVLWHADDYAVGAVRLLSQVGLLRDPAREAELKDADVVMRRLADEDKAKRNREYSAALERIQRVRDLHSHGRGTDTCNGCGDSWPCSTTEALDGQS